MAHIGWGSDGSLNGEFEKAMAYLDAAGGKVALFMIAGRVRCVKETSVKWGWFMDRHKGDLIGVYDTSANALDVRADIAEAMGGVDIDRVHRRVA